MVEVLELTAEELEALEEYRINFADQWKHDIDVGYVSKDEFLSDEMDLRQDQDRPANAKDGTRVNTRGLPETEWLNSRVTGYDECRNAIWFPPKTHMDWHTNSRDPGQRTYFIYNKGESCFRWFDGEKHHESWEGPGWTKRVFTIPDPSEGYLWHCVWAGDWRLSIGFVIWPEKRPLEALS